MRLRINRAFAGYLLAGIAMLLALLYMRFPGETLTAYLRAEAARRPEWLLSIDGARPAIPPGVTLENVTAALRSQPEATLQLDLLGFRPGWLSLLQGRLALVVSAAGYGGHLRGSAEYVNPFTTTGPLALQAELREIRVEKCAWLQQALARQVTGTLNGSLTFSGVAGAIRNGSGSADFTLAGGSYQLLESLLGFDLIEFNKVEAKISYRNGAVKIAQLTIHGEKLRISLKGNILLDENLAESQIDLNGSIEIPVQGNKRMMLAISGTLANAKTRFL